LPVKRQQLHSSPRLPQQRQVLQRFLHGSLSGLRCGSLRPRQAGPHGSDERRPGSRAAPQPRERERWRSVSSRAHAHVPRAHRGSPLLQAAPPCRGEWRGALGRTAAQSGSTGAELAGHGRAFARLLRHASDPAARSCTLRTQTRRPPAGAAPSDARQLRRAQQMQRFVLSGAVLCVLGTVRPSDAVACLCCGTRHATTLRPKRQGDGR
jgi:hypothetical protein